MNQKFIYGAVFFLLVVMSQPVFAARSACSYNKIVQFRDTTFNVSSQKANSCAVQIVKVTALKRGKEIASLKLDVDYLIKSAQAVDLDGKGSPELVVISRPTEGVQTEALDIYWLDGKTISRAMLPAPEEKKGYKGGDRYQLNGSLIIRTIPVYGDNDPVGKPTSGTRTLKYKFKDGTWALIDHVVKGADAPTVSAAQSVPQPAPAQEPLVETNTAAPDSAGLVIAAITTGRYGIGISANRAVMKYKVMRLDKPERIAIDIPDAESSLAGKQFEINEFGISLVKIGRQKGFLRVVLVSPLKKFPKHEVTSSAGGLRIEFSK